MKNIKIIVSISLLVFFNLLLLFINMKQKGQIETLTSQTPSWSYESAGYSTATISHPDVELPNKGVSLLIFFTDRGCVNCVAKETWNLNKFYQKYERFTHIYLIGKSKTYLKEFGSTFPFELITLKDGLLLDKQFKFTNPVALLVDANGLIQKAYISEVGNPQKSDYFYQRMTSLFQTIE